MKRILALDLHPRSFGFVVFEVFEGRDRLLDWGVRSFRSGVNQVVTPRKHKLRALLDEFRPDLVLVNKQVLQKPRGTLRIRELVTVLNGQAKVAFVLPQTVKRVFEGCTNRYAIAEAIGKKLPELRWICPPKRKIWQSEDYRLSIFNATALAIAYFATHLLG